MIQYEIDQIKKYSNGDKQSLDQSLDQPMESIRLSIQALPLLGKKFLNTLKRSF